MTLTVDVDGGVVRLRADYDEDLVARLRELPDRRWDRPRGEWVLPARRRHLAAVSRLVADLPGVEFTAAAEARFARHGPGGITLDQSMFCVRLATPSEKNVASVRAVPGARYRHERKSWLIPATRGSALALRALVDEAVLVATPDAAARLDRTASGTPPARRRGPTGTDRRSPIAHWRHVTRGPVFNANRRRQEWVDGVGWCVRIRVAPGAGATASPGDAQPDE